MIASAGHGLVRELALADALAWEADRLADVVAERCSAAALLWSCEPALVAPSRMSSLFGFNSARMCAARAGWPVHLRATGGDLVPQGPGIVNLTLVFRGPRSAAFSLEAAYRRLTAPICEALSEVGLSPHHAPVPGAFCDGRFNVTVLGQKFAGTAQRWRPMAGGYAVQAHALMLMHTPDMIMIAALNRFYRDCGIDRVINASAHIGLHDLVPVDSRNDAERLFLKRVRYGSSEPT